MFCVEVESAYSVIVTWDAIHPKSGLDVTYQLFQGKVKSWGCSWMLYEPFVRFSLGEAFCGEAIPKPTHPVTNTVLSWVLVVA